MSKHFEPLPLEQQLKHKRERGKFWLRFFLITLIMGVLYYIALTQTNIQYRPTGTSLGDLLYRLFIGPFTHERALDRTPDYLYYMAETVVIAYVGTLIGAILAIPFAFLAARNMVGKAAFIGKSISNAVRAFPELLFAIIFVAAVGMGPLAGILAIGINSIGMLTKLYSEVIESIDMSVVEAMKASGANKTQVIWYGVIPQIIPEFSSYAIYRFEIDVRAASVLGLVGAGGIGAPLIFAARNRAWEEVGMMLIIIILVVTIIDYLSAFIRRRIV